MQYSKITPNLHTSSLFFPSFSTMRPFRLSAIFMAVSALALSASGLPQPQTGDVSADDVLKTAGSAARYGSDSGNVDQGLLDELFGSGGSTGSLDSGYEPPPPEKQKV